MQNSIKNNSKEDMAGSEDIKLVKCKRGEVFCLEDLINYKNQFPDDTENKNDDSLSLDDSGLVGAR